MTAYASKRLKRLFLIVEPYGDKSEPQVYVFDEQSGERNLLRTIQFAEYDSNLNPFLLRGEVSYAAPYAERSGFFKRKKDEKYSDCVDRITDDFCDSLISRIAYETHLPIRIMIAVMCAEEESEKDAKER